MSSSTSSTIHQNVVPSEVGWQFVPQYYTFVNKQPNRLHCFYTKTSTFVHGNEGEESKPCFGQHEIHEKITSIGFQDCKVFIHSVDAQASANGGIIIQVIGEMSNRGEPWRKFVQTFFLAEQPNGYFVLNDIFRFLKEESIEADDVDEAAEPEVAPSEPEPTPVAEVHQAPAREPTPPPPAVAVPAAAPSVVPSFSAPSEEPPTNDVPESTAQPPTPVTPEPQPAPAAATAQPNGHSTATEPEKHTPAPAPPIEKSPVPSPAPPAVPPAVPPAAPTLGPIPPVTQAALPPPPARSWASLAASNQKKWGPAVAQESRGVTETPASPAPSSGTQTPAAPPSLPAPHRGGPANRNEHPMLQAAQAVNTPQVFIKGIVDPITNTSLGNVLTRFGPIKDLEVVRSKACAFAEFNSVDIARRAIIASMNHNQGGEGGVYVESGNESPPIRIFIETRKERGDRPAPRPRGGAPPVNGGEGRPQGGYRGRGGGGRGRGGPPGK